MPIPSLSPNATWRHYVQGAIVSVEFLENSLELSETSADISANIRRYLWKHPRTLLKDPRMLSRPYWRGGSDMSAWMALPCIVVALLLGKEI